MFTGHSGPLHSPSVLQGQKHGITREINITKIHLSIIMKINNGVSCYSIKRCRSTVLKHHLFRIIILETIPPFHNTTISDSDKSWPSKQLVYHTLRANNGSELSLKFDLQKHRSTHISDIFTFEHTSLGNFPLCWCHSLTLRTTTRTHIYSNKYLQCFLLIVVSFLTYLIISTPDKMLLTFQSTLTQLFNVYNQS